MFISVMFRHNRIAYYCFYIKFRMTFSVLDVLLSRSRVDLDSQKWSE